MSAEEAISLMLSGIPVRRAAHQQDPALYGAEYVCVAGAGTARAVAVRRLDGVEEVVTAAMFGSEEWLAEDWERADIWSTNA